MMIWGLRLVRAFPLALTAILLSVIFVSDTTHSHGTHFVSQGSGFGEGAIEDPTGRSAQIATVSKMKHLLLAIEVFHDVNGYPPTRLSDLFLDDTIYKDPTSSAKLYLNDYWGRPFYYYCNGEDFVLASFGADGKPSPPTGCAGCVLEEHDPDADIVWLNQHWAQSPHGVGRH
jgi:hypothetical protein